MKSTDVLKQLGGPGIPEKPAVTVNLEIRGEDQFVWLTQCVDPVFDLELLVEGLAAAIVIAAEYTQEPGQKILKDVINGLTEGVNHHGKIERKK